MNSNYAKAVRYATKCGFDRDFVHDAYILWWNRHKRNIFNESNGTVIRTLKNLIFSNYNKSTFMSGGAVNLKKMYDINYLEVIDGADHDVLLSKVGFDDFDIKMEYNAVMEKANELRGTRREIYQYLSKGFTPTEIQDITGISKSLVGWYRNRLKVELR